MEDNVSARLIANFIGFPDAEFRAKFPAYPLPIEPSDYERKGKQDDGQIVFIADFKTKFRYNVVLLLDLANVLSHYRDAE